VPEVLWVEVVMTATRGTSNSNARGSSYTRRRRREWLVETYRADVDVKPLPPSWQEPRNGRVRWEADTGLEPMPVPRGEGEAACRCYRCGDLLTVETVTVDRIVPGCMGGTYRRNNIRPACGQCNSETGGALSRHRKAS
jgi:hypothetical protein